MTMTGPEFWAIIRQSPDASGGIMAVQADALRSILRRRSPSGLRGFLDSSVLVGRKHTLTTFGVPFGSSKGDVGTTTSGTSAPG